MSITTKKQSKLDYEGAIKSSYNDVDASITVNGFVVGKVGHKITRSIISPTVDDYSFYDSTTLLYTIRVTYNNSAHEEINEVERTN